MRITKETNVDGLKVTVYHWNNKYLLKFENGRNELTYKISQMDISSDEDVETFLSDKEIISLVHKSFEKMDETLTAFFAKI